VLQKCSRNTALDRFLSLISPHPKQGTRKTPPRRRKNRSFLRIFRIIERLKSYTRTRQKYYERTVRIVKECDIIFTRCIYIRIDLSVFLVNKRIDRQVRIFSFSFRRITLHPFSFFFFFYINLPLYTSHPLFEKSVTQQKKSKNGFSDCHCACKKNITTYSYVKRFTRKARRKDAATTSHQKALEAKMFSSSRTLSSP